VIDVFPWNSGKKIFQLLPHHQGVGRGFWRLFSSRSGHSLRWFSAFIVVLMIPAEIRRCLIAQLLDLSSLLAFDRDGSRGRIRFQVSLPGFETGLDGYYLPGHRVGEGEQGPLPRGFQAFLGPDRKDSVTDADFLPLGHWLTPRWDG